jgi:hypothetical protein
MLTYADAYVCCRILTYAYADVCVGAGQAGTGVLLNFIQDVAAGQGVGEQVVVGGEQLVGGGEVHTLGVLLGQLDVVEGGIGGQVAAEAAGEESEGRGGGGGDGGAGAGGDGVQVPENGRNGGSAGNGVDKEGLRQVQALLYVCMYVCIDVYIYV